MNGINTLYHPLTYFSIQPIHDLLTNPHQVTNHHPLSSLYHLTCCFLSSISTHCLLYVSTHCLLYVSTHCLLFPIYDDIVIITNHRHHYCHHHYDNRDRLSDHCNHHQ